MRVVAWILGGIVLGVLTGVATGLFRRQPTKQDQRSGELATAYAGGYAPPTPAVDRMASRYDGTVDDERLDTALDRAPD